MRVSDWRSYASVKQDISVAFPEHRSGRDFSSSLHEVQPVPTTPATGVTVPVSQIPQRTRHGQVATTEDFDRELSYDPQETFTQRSVPQTRDYIGLTIAIFPGSTSLIICGRNDGLKIFLEFYTTFPKSYKNF